HYAAGFSSETGALVKEEFSELEADTGVGFASRVGQKFGLFEPEERVAKYEAACPRWSARTEVEEEQVALGPHASPRRTGSPHPQAQGRGLRARGMLPVPIAMDPLPNSH